MRHAIKRHAVQIAGVIDHAEAQLLSECGADYMGFPLRLPVNTVDLPEAAAAAIIREFKACLPSVLITYLGVAGEIVKFAGEMDTTIVQLHGEIEAVELERLRRVAPDLTIIKSLVVRHDANLDELMAVGKSLQGFVDAFITDTFDPITGATGATGKSHDWSISRTLVEELEVPIILAGGLNPDNVAEAIRHVRPWAVDAHTGVEGGDGRKDRELVRRFVIEARSAFAGTPPALHM